MVLTVVLLCFLQVLVAAVKPSDFAVVGYMPEWRYESVNWDDIAKYNTHIILFSLEMNGNGDIIAKDRFPKREIYDKIYASARKYGSKLLICFGGNGRSDGFNGMTSNSENRKNFLSQLQEYIQTYDLDGVDYNWEYCGYDFKTGYKGPDQVNREYDNFSLLLEDTRRNFDQWSADKKEAANSDSLDKLIITLAYYPDGVQEKHLAQRNMHDNADLLHMMSYDQQGKHHSSYEFAEKCIEQGLKYFPSQKLTVGVPFYGRRAGKWFTYEELLESTLRKYRGFETLDFVEGISFNGVNTIAKKTKLALNKNIGGVMIWEVGQDCQISDNEKKKSSCFDKKLSLHYTIKDTLAKFSNRKKDKHTSSTNEVNFGVEETKEEL